MNKAELVAQIQSKLGKDTSKASAERALEAVLESIKDSIKKAGKEVRLTGDASKADAVQLVGFGTFSVVRRDARTGHNPSTGESIKIKASKNIKFKPGAGLKAID